MIDLKSGKLSWESWSFWLRSSVAIVALLTSLSLVTAPALADQSVTWTTFDVDLTLNEDASYHVVERQVIDFSGGPFHFGFATIPTRNTEGMGNFVVSEETSSGVETYDLVSVTDYDEEPGTYSVERTSTDITVNWGFDPTTNESRTFILEYDVFGALRVYPDLYGEGQTAEQIWWIAIDDEVTDIGPVENSTVTINLPQPVNTGEVVVGQDGEEVAVGSDLLAATPDQGDVSSNVDQYTDDGQTFTWTKSDMSSGDSFEVRLQFPAVVEAAPPSWQAADDEQRQKQEEENEHEALLNVFFLGIGLLGAIGGGLGIYGLWYTKGRDPHTGMVADFIPTPPDDLPPGAAGTLLDETADQEDIVATLVDLGRRGVLKIDETEEEGILGFGGGRDFQLTLVQPDAKQTDFEKELVGAIFGGSVTAGTSVKMSDVKTSFDKSQKEIKEELYQELVSRGYFLSSPEGTRQKWRRFGILALVAVFFLCSFLGRVAGDAVLYWLPIIVLAALGVTILMIARAMPKKTLAGAEAAAKWRAFKRYLDDIEKYEHLAEAKGIFEKYLPFAVAFGLESSWVTKFAQVDAPAPEWYGTPYPAGGYPYGRRRRGGFGGPVIIATGGHGGSSGRAEGGGGNPDIDLPDMQDLSDSASGGLQGMSDSLSDMFNVAGKIFSGMSSGRGGGFGSGGGGHFGGGGGGGGSSGGGGRGFG
jgi:uncharacterized protein (TIGR04222 family)